MEPPDGIQDVSDDFSAWEILDDEEEEESLYEIIDAASDLSLSSESGAAPKIAADQHQGDASDIFEQRDDDNEDEEIEEELQPEEEQLIPIDPLINDPMPEEEAAAALKRRIHSYYHWTLKPIIRDLKSSALIRANVITGKTHQALHFGHNDIMWNLLAARPDYCNELLSAMLAASKDPGSAIEHAMIYWNTSIQELDISIDSFRACLQDIGRTISACQKIGQVVLSLKYHVDFALMDGLVASFLQSIHHVTALDLELDRLDEEPVPLPVLNCLSEMPNLVTLRVICHSDCLLLVHVCQAAMAVKRLCSFSLCGTKTNLVALTLHEAKALARFFYENALTSLTLERIRFVGKEVAYKLVRCFGDMDNLVSLHLTDLMFDEGELEFYGALGAFLPAMGNLTTLALSTSENASQLPALSPSILNGAQRLSKLCHLSLNGYAWSIASGQELADLLFLNKSLRKLTIGRGTIASGEGSAFEPLVLALRYCSLDTLSFQLSGPSASESFSDIVNGVGSNQSIKTLNLESSSAISFETLTDMLQSLNNNVSLKKLTLSCKNCGTGEVAGEITDSVFERLISALEANVGLEEVYGLPKIQCAVKQAKLWATLYAVGRLNRLGRRYIKTPNDANFHGSAVHILRAVQDSLDCLFLHLHEVPTIFQDQKS